LFPASNKFVKKGLQISSIVKQVSWFKSRLLLRIEIKYTNEYEFLIKTKDSILIEKYIQQMRRRKPSVAWLGLIEAGSVLIIEKRKHLSKMSDRVSRNVLKYKRLRVESRECFIEVYIDNQSLFIIVY
jgi:hypothetical protein